MVLCGAACTAWCCSVLPALLGAAGCCMHCLVLLVAACIVSCCWLLPALLDAAQFCLHCWVLHGVACTAGCCSFLPALLGAARCWQHCLVLRGASWPCQLCPALPLPFARLHKVRTPRGDAGVGKAAVPTRSARMQPGRRRPEPQESCLGGYLHAINTSPSLRSSDRQEGLSEPGYEALRKSSVLSSQV